MHRASQWLSKGRSLERQMVRNLIEVLRDDSTRNSDVLRVRAPQKRQVFAQRLAPQPAIVAVIARGAVRRNHAHARSPAVGDVRADRDDLSGELVTERRRHMLHDCWVATAKCLQVSAASQRTVNPYDDLTGTSRGDRDILDAHITGGIENCCLHLIVFLLILACADTLMLTRCRGIKEILADHLAWAMKPKCTMVTISHNRAYDACYPLLVEEAAVKADLVLGIDCSTTASKAVAWNRDGVAVVEGRAPLSLVTPQPGWGEQDARQWWEATVQATAEVTKRVNSQRIAAICVTHQRETFVPVDSAGDPLRNGILWLDERSRMQLAALDRQFGRRRVAQPDRAPSVDDPVITQASLA